MQSRIIAAIAIVMAGPAVANDTKMSATLTGNELYDSCEASPDTPTGLIEFGVCTGYISGAMDSYLSFRAEVKRGSCLKTGVTVRQQRDTVIQYLRENPTERQFSASYSVIKALEQYITDCPTG